MFYFTFFSMINTNIFYFVEPKGILIKRLKICTVDNISDYLK